MGDNTRTKTTAESPKSSSQRSAPQNNAPGFLLNSPTITRLDLIRRRQQIQMQRASLRIGPAGDRYEQEADRIADSVMRMPVDHSVEARHAVPLPNGPIQRSSLANSITPLQRTPAPEEELQEKKEDEEIQESLLQKTAASDDDEIQPSLNSSASANSVRAGFKPAPIQRTAIPKDDEIQRSPEDEEAQAKIQRTPEDDEIQRTPGNNTAQRALNDTKEEESVGARHASHEAQAKIQRTPEDEEAQAKLQRTPEDEKAQAKIQRTPEDEEAQAKLQRTPEDEEAQAKLQRAPEDEKAQAKLQRTPEDEEAQAKLQRTPEDEKAQAKIQRTPEDEEAQAKLQRTPEDEEAQAKLQRSPGPEGGSISPQLSSSIHSARGGGRSLSSDELSFYEPRFGADFSHVRVHTGGQANHLSRSVNARAFTVGSDIFFGSGQYSSNTYDGKKLMAHELTHTVQQGGVKRKVAVQSAVNEISDKKSVDARHISHSQSAPEDEEAQGSLQRALAPFADTRYTSHETRIQRAPWYKRWGRKISGTFRSGRNYLRSGANRLRSGIRSGINYLSAGVQKAIQWVKERIASRARATRGYKLLCVILKKDPITKRKVARNGKNILNAILELMPSGFKRSLKRMGLVNRAARWLDRKIKTLKISGTKILNRLKRIIKEATLTKWNSKARQGLNIIRAPILKLKKFARNVTSYFWKLIKKAAKHKISRYIRKKSKDKKSFIFRAYPLMRVILGRDPVTGRRVKRSGINLVKGFVRLSKNGEEQLKQMKKRGTLQKTARWVDRATGKLTKAIKGMRGAFIKAWRSLSYRSFFRPFKTIQRLVNIFKQPLYDIFNFVWFVGRKILKYIKDSLLGWLSKKARGTKGYPLLRVILAKDPFTGKAVERTPENIIHGFMSLMDGGEEKFKEMKKTGAIARAVTWINGALTRLNLTPKKIIGLFKKAWNLMTLKALSNPLKVFQELIGLFAPPINRLIAFAWDVLKKIVEIILQIMNFPIDLIRNIIAKAMQAIDDIKKDPIGFFLNLLAAIKEGFSRFFKNILKHLLGGLSNWLMRELKDANVTPPKDFSAGSIFAFVADVLGVTMEKIWKKLGDKIGQERVAKIRATIDRAVGIWRVFKDFMTRGPIVLWEIIEKKLGNLWNMVLDHVSNWVQSKIIAKATQKVLMMLDPTGIMAVVNSAIALYNAIESFIKYVREMLEIVNSFVEGVAEIARGKIGRAATYVENSLARAVPVAIGFLANQAGLSGVGRRIGEMIEALRGKVDEAIDWLLDKAIAAGTSFVNMVQSGVTAVKEWWKAKKTLTTKDGKNHELSFSGSGASAKLMIRSEPKPYVDYLKELKDKHGLKDEQMRPAIVRAQLIDRAKSRHDKLPENKKEANNQKIQGLLAELADLTEKLPIPLQAKISPQHGPKRNTYGTSVIVPSLFSQNGKDVEGGQKASKAPANENWSIISKRIAPGRKRTYYVRGHLLNHHLGGPASWFNLTPITQDANLFASNSHYKGFEEDVKDAVLKQNKTVYFSVIANYSNKNRSENIKYFKAQGTKEGDKIAAIITQEQFIPDSLTCYAKEINGSKTWNHVVPNTINTEPDSYSLSKTARTKVYIDDCARKKDLSGLQRLDGIDNEIAQLIVSARPANGYRYKNKFPGEVQAIWQNIEKTPGFQVFIYSKNG